jgi:ABC-type transport system involved in multi-copper enzyme maturation permease subunit
MRRLIEHNPIGWLERRTWQGRLLTWIWFAIIISVYSMLLTDGPFLQGAFPLEDIMGWLMALTIAATASGSFRRERETGVLELLLVAPLSTHQIIWARLRAIWGQFAPASLTFLLLWLYVSTFIPNEAQGGGIVSVFVTLFTIPAIGLYFSLRCKGFIAALVWTLICGVAMPKLATLILWVLLSIDRIPMDADLFLGLMRMAAPTVHIIMASLLLHRLWKRLETRSFTLERAVN